MPLPSFRMGEAYNTFAPAFTPSSLFASGEQGVWFDPSDFNPNWRRNLLTYSENFSNAVWIKQSVIITPNTVIAPDGTLSGSKLYCTTSSGQHRIDFSDTAGAGTLTLTVYAKAAEFNFLGLGSAQFGGQITSFNLTNGTYDKTVLGGSLLSASMVSVGDGWFKCSVTGTSLGYKSISVFNTQNNFSFTDLTSSGIYIWGAQLEKGSKATAYQKITDGIQDYYSYQPQPVMFEDIIGSIPARLEQPVGLMLDKSKGLVLGSELLVNGGFDTDTDWTKASAGWSIVGGTLNYLGTGNIYEKTSQPVTTKIGTTYRITFNVTAISSGTLYLGFGGTASSLQTSSQAISTVGTYSFYFSGVFTTTYIIIQDNSATQTFSVDNISVKEIAGNHAKAPANANRPTLSARVNLLTKTEDFSDAVWSKAAGCTATANVITTTSGGAWTRQLGLTVAGNPPVKLLCKVGKTTTATTFPMFELELLGSPIINAFVILNTNTGVAVKRSGSSYTPVNISAVDKTTYWELSFEAKNINGTGVVNLYSYPGASSDGTSYTASTGSVTIYGVDLRPTNAGSLLPPYQRVNTASDYDTVGFPLYLKCNGTSSAMVTNTVDFTTVPTDKMTVVTGVRKLSDALDGIVCELSADVNTNIGSFAILAPLSGVTNRLGFSLRGSVGRTNRVTNSTDYPAPTTLVLSSSYYLAASTSANEILPRVNSVIPTLTTTGAADSGTGNFGNYPLYIFSRAGTSVWLNGNFYGAIIRGATTNIPNLIDAENYVATKTGITF